MNLTFPSDKSTEISFKVSIAGTQSTPSAVLVVLERDMRQISYSANKGNGDDWTVCIENPGQVFAAGDVKFCVNVIVNSRMFTPIKAIATITEELPVESVPAITETIQEPPATIVVEEVHEMQEEAKPKIKMSLLKSIEPPQRIETSIPVHETPGQATFFNLKKVRTVYR